MKFEPKPVPLNNDERNFFNSYNKQENTKHVSDYCSIKQQDKEKQSFKQICLNSQKIMMWAIANLLS